MIRCLAIDDEPLALQQIAAYIGKVPFLELAAQCQSALEAHQFLQNDTVDVIFCDINMPDLNGMDFIKALVAPPLVVFTTAYAEYAVEGFKVNAVDYLLKPFGLQDFMRAANRVRERLEGTTATAPAPSAPVASDSDADTIFLKTDYRIVKVAISDIRYVEAMSEYLKVWMEEDGRTPAPEFHAHPPFLHHQPQQDSGGQQKPCHHGPRHLSSHRRYVQGNVPKLPRHEISWQIICFFQDKALPLPHVIFTT